MDEFAEITKTDEIKFKYAKGMRDIIGKEIHPYHEIFFFISGNAKFISESGTEQLQPFTTVIIPKESFHCFVVSGDERDYCRCVFNFTEVSELDSLIDTKMNKIFLTRDKNIAEIFNRLREFKNSGLTKTETDVLLKSLFAQILVYLNQQSVSMLNTDISSITTETLDFINKNIDKQLSVAYLAEQLHISESNLAHVFKRDLHISIHKYIVEKRLVLANKMIKNSVGPTVAASECGFSDYSGFYKQYKKMFGVSPSGTSG